MILNIIVNIGNVVKYAYNAIENIHDTTPQNKRTCKSLHECATENTCLYRGSTVVSTNRHKVNKTAALSIIFFVFFFSMRLC